MASFKRAVYKVHTFVDSKIPTKLGNQYTVKLTQDNRLGQGGFGTVYRGFDKKSNKDVAIKEVDKEKHPNFCERERNFMRKCSHENIIKLLDYEEDGTKCFFIMEYCPEGNLDDFVKPKDIDLWTCLCYMKDIVAGLLFMHESVICHRDLKPTNILVKSDRCLKIADFGLAKHITGSSSGESATGGVGSTKWMAPEVFMPEDATDRPIYSRAIDIFSLGLLFLSLLMHRAGEPLAAHTGISRHFS